jgi:hypothetical protein
MRANPQSEFPDEQGGGAPYRLTVGSQVREGRADADGVVVESNLYLGDRCALSWGQFRSVTEQSEHPVPDVLPEEPRFLYSRTIYLGDEATLPIDKQLHNLGYVDEDIEENRSRFRGDYEIAQGETVDDAIRRVHREGRESGTVTGV